MHGLTHYRFKAVARGVSSPLDKQINTIIISNCIEQRAINGPAIYFIAHQCQGLSLSLHISRIQATSKCHTLESLKMPAFMISSKRATWALILVIFDAT